MKVKITIYEQGLCDIEGESLANNYSMENQKAKNNVISLLVDRLWMVTMYCGMTKKNINE